MLGNVGGTRHGATSAYSDPADLLTLVNGVSVGIGGIYLVTSSVAVTAIAAGAVVLLAGLVLTRHR